jgi:hypothetical protein
MAGAEARVLTVDPAMLRFSPGDSGHRCLSRSR